VNENIEREKEQREDRKKKQDAPASVGRRKYGHPLRDSWRSHHQPLLAIIEK